MATFDKKVLTSLRNKATVLGIVLIGLMSCNKNNNTTNVNNAQDEYVIAKIDSLLNANRQLTEKLDSCEHAAAKPAAKKPVAKKPAAKKPAQKAAPQAAPVVAPAPQVAPSNGKDSVVYEITEEKKSTFKIVAGDSVKIGTLRAHGNADGEVEIQITGGAEIDELDMADYRTKMPAPVVVQPAPAPAPAPAAPVKDAASESNANYKRNVKLVVTKTVIARQH